MVKRKNKFIWILFVIALALLVVSLFLVLGKEKPLQVVEYDVEFIVADMHPGFDVNGSLLIFGRTSPGGPGITRFVNITNEYGFPLEVRVLLTEDIAKALDTNSSYFFEVDEVRRIPINLDVPSDFPLGNYTGKIRFEMYKCEDNENL